MKDWIEIEKQKPPPKTRVEFMRISTLSVVPEWKTTGWINETGSFSVTQTKDNKITFKNSKPSHWRKIEK